VEIIHYLLQMHNFIIMCKFVYAVIIIKFSVPFINIISIGAGCDFVEFTWCHSKLCTVTTFIIANKTQNMCV